MQRLVSVISYLRLEPKERQASVTGSICNTHKIKKMDKELSSLLTSAEWRKKSQMQLATGVTSFDEKK